MNGSTELWIEGRGRRNWERRASGGRALFHGSWPGTARKNSMDPLPCGLTTSRNRQVQYRTGGRGRRGTGHTNPQTGPRDMEHHLTGGEWTRTGALKSLEDFKAHQTYITHLAWNTSGYPRRSWKALLERGTSETPCLACCKDGCFTPVVWFIGILTLLQKPKLKKWKS